jgi:hypothetical protein
VGVAACAESVVDIHNGDAARARIEHCEKRGHTAERCVYHPALKYRAVWGITFGDKYAPRTPCMWRFATIYCS